ncbi:MAG TPA: hypothetical protein PKA05_23925, partial [Roseiflexaceae bacterium]|nr:hypothetical protein [Roseiflexaceae bacterium]
GASIVYGVAQSLGSLAIRPESHLSLDAYRDLVTGATPAVREFWPALGFSLWVSLASTSLATLGALLVAVALSNRRRPAGGPGRRLRTRPPPAHARRVPGGGLAAARRRGADLGAE